MKRICITYRHAAIVFLTATCLLSAGAAPKKSHTAATPRDTNTAVNIPDSLMKPLSVPLPQTLVDKQIDSLIVYARKYTGTPYRRGGKGPNRFDCSGFMQYVFNHFSYPLNASSASQFLQGISVADEQIRRGDLVFFKGSNSRRARVGHVGLVTEVYPDGRFKFIHASTSQGIREDWSSSPYYAKRYMGARRIYFAQIDQSLILDAIIDLEEIDDDTPFDGD
ncbi:C40 family peptidase [Barnesiella sp. ET7]|uniref:C40 family peptidase n=1 Tax=Barnesiella sp. ET7 TaxID=2972460 RepID=UPI0021AC2814|nr:C40 family peptidase [Barnesiella sp. ET7]MCR8910687.1 C40 family peptidase [Barnesiella sp. ET7]